MLTKSEDKTLLWGHCTCLFTYRKWSAVACHPQRTRIMKYNVTPKFPYGLMLMHLEMHFPRSTVHKKKFRNEIHPCYVVDIQGTLSPKRWTLQFLSNGGLRLTWFDCYALYQFHIPNYRFWSITWNFSRKSQANKSAQSYGLTSYRT